MPRHPFIVSEGEQGGRVLEGNGWLYWCTIMVVEAAILGGDRPGDGCDTPGVTVVATVPRQ
jgi:hypothetical protein